MRTALLIAAVACAACAAACSACSKNPAPDGTPGTTVATPVNRTSVPPDAGPVALRDVAMWASARDGTTEDLASLATHEGAAGLVEAAAEPALRTTAIRAMGYAYGWAQLPFLIGTATADDDAESRMALESVLELAARPRRSEDVEDESELSEGCGKLLALARDLNRGRDRRIPAIKALRMMPCPKSELPTDLDAR